VVIINRPFFIGRDMTDITNDGNKVQVQYDGHIALVDGVDNIPLFLAPFTDADTVDYDKAGLPTTTAGELVYLHTQCQTGVLVPTGLLTKVLNKPYTDRVTITRKTETATVDPTWVMGTHLRDYQAKAVKTSLRKKRCVISIPTAGGKSLIIEELCRALRHVLILVPSKLLLYQMQEQLKAYDVGLVGDGHLDIGHLITIAIPDTLYNKRADALVRAWLGAIPTLIVDECHTFSCARGAVISSLMKGTQYRIGLSATPVMDNLLEGLIGPLAYVVAEQDLIASGYILAPTIEVVYTPPLDTPIPSHLHRWYISMRGNGFNAVLYQALYSHCILHNSSRNQLIADMAKEYVDSDRGPLIIIVQRIEDTPGKKDKHGNDVEGKVSHATILGPLLKARGLEYRTLSGTSKKKDRQEIVSGLGDGSIKLVVAGANILKEGVNMLQVTGTIIAGAGRGGAEQSGLIQQAGRLLRVADKAQPTLYIINDDCHTLFSNQARTLIDACVRTYGKDSVRNYVPLRVPQKKTVELVGDVR
jgi:superfamily II DNA or RNA helicase